MKSSFLSPVATLIVFFVLLFAYTKIAGPIPFHVTSITTQKVDSFNVSGEGKADAIPDIALVNAGVAVNSVSVKDVQARLNTSINAVSEAVKKLGVDAKDIQTSNYNIYPTYDYTSGNQKITGYQASTTLIIKVKNIDGVNDVIDAATANGANQIGGVTFDVEDKTKAENDAREKAVAEARRKAENAATIAGFRLGNVINYSENFGGYPGPIVPLYAKDAAIRESAGATRVEPGSAEIRVTVSLTYEIL